MLSLTSRRIIFIFFLGAFIVTAPLLILRTAGYKYDFKKSALEKTGSFSIKPTPGDAEIYLDGKIQIGSRSSGTLRINDLLPGKYTVEIKKNGYYSWQKKLDVFENTFTFINQITLFKTSLPENISQENILSTLPSHQSQKIAYLTDNELKVFNISNSQISTLDKTDKKWKLISWSNNDQKILLQNSGGDYLIYQPENSSPKTLLSKILSKKFTFLRWDNNADYLLYGRTGNDFYQINIATGDYRILQHFTQKAKESYGQDFLFSNNSLYYIHYTTKGTFLKKISTDINEKNKESIQLMNLPLAGDFNFYLGPNDVVCLIDRNKQALYLLNGEFNQILLKAEAKDFDWSNDGQRLLYYNDFEIQIFDLKTAKQQLITRYSQPLVKAEFLPNINYIVYSFGDNIVISELDNRDDRNTIELIRGGRVSDFSLSLDAKNIYFSGQVGSQTGLYKVNIQE